MAPAWLLAGAGGFLGATLRHLVTQVVQRAAGPVFPWGTLAVNVAGCFAIGALLGAWSEPIPASRRAFVIVGVLGGFTTFSAFGADTFDLARGGRLGLAALNVLLQVGGGLAATAAGFLVVSRNA